MQSITPPLIAVIGSDGSGKSTVCEHLITVVEKYGAAERKNPAVNNVLNITWSVLRISVQPYCDNG